RSKRDWSSDVCSSDLAILFSSKPSTPVKQRISQLGNPLWWGKIDFQSRLDREKLLLLPVLLLCLPGQTPGVGQHELDAVFLVDEIGRASCREGECIFA